MDPWAGRAIVFIVLNGSPILASQQVYAGSGGLDGSVSTTYRLQASDYVALNVYADGGKVVSAPRREDLA